MTLEEFRAQRREVPDLGAELGLGDGTDAHLKGLPGFVYPGGFYIHKDFRTGWYGMTAAQNTSLSRNLEVLEEALYRRAVREGYFDA